MNRQQHLWLAVGLGLFVVAALAGAWFPMIRARATLLDEARRLEQELAKPQDGPDRIARLRANMERLTALSRGRTAVIPASSDIAGLVQSISGTLDQLALSKREITTGAVRHLDGASALPVSITLDGSFQRVIKAIRSVEGLPRLVRVHRLRMESTPPGKQEDGPTGLLHVELVIDAFYGGDAASIAEVSP